MYAASFESIVRTILIILLIYFAFKLFITVVWTNDPEIFLKKIGNKVQQQFNQQAPGEKAKKGEVVIEKKPKKGRKSNKNVGEYIDYEEID
jgi:hypothetical protein